MQLVQLIDVPSNIGELVQSVLTILLYSFVTLFWGHCNLPIWQLFYGYTTLWFHYSMVSLLCGSTTLWFHSSMVPLVFGSTGLWFHYSMVPLWLHYSMVPHGSTGPLLWLIFPYIVLESASILPDVYIVWPCGILLSQSHICVLYMHV